MPAFTWQKMAALAVLCLLPARSNKLAWYLPLQRVLLLYSVLRNT